MLDALNGLLAGSIKGPKTALLGTPSAVTLWVTELPAAMPVLKNPEIPAEKLQQPLGGVVTHTCDASTLSASA